MAYCFDCGLTWVRFTNMTATEKADYEKEHPFEYNNVEEYMADIKRWLTESDWHYTEKDAAEIVESDTAYIKDCFDKRFPIDLTGADIGYCCG